VNLSLEVSNIVISVCEIYLLLQQFLLELLQVLDILGLRCLEILKLLSLSDGSLLCLVQKVVVPE
jgi:hypothetical protein